MSTCLELIGPPKADDSELSYKMRCRKAKNKEKRDKEMGKDDAGEAEAAEPEEEEEESMRGTVEKAYTESERRLKEMGE